VASGRPAGDPSPSRHQISPKWAKYQGVGRHSFVRPIYGGVGWSIKVGKRARGDGLLGGSLEPSRHHISPRSRQEGSGLQRFFTTSSLEASKPRRPSERCLERGGDVTAHELFMNSHGKVCTCFHERVGAVEKQWEQCGSSVFLGRSPSARTQQSSAAWARPPFSRARGPHGVRDVTPKGLFSRIFQGEGSVFQNRNHNHVQPCTTMISPSSRSRAGRGGLGAHGRGASNAA